MKSRTPPKERESLNFEDEEKTITDILTNYEKREVAIFIGAGAGIDEALKPRLPTGKEFANMLIEHKSKGEKEKKKKYIQEISQKYGVKKSEITPEMCYEYFVEQQKQYPIARRLLKDIFYFYKNPKGRITIPSTYRYLAKLLLGGFLSSVVTTNFDEKLEEAIYEEIDNRYPEKLLVSLNSLCDYKEESLDRGSEDIVYLLKLHGTLSKPYTIISTNVKKLDDKKKELLKSLINDNHCLIVIGYRGGDRDIQDAFAKIFEETNESKHIYWCMRGPNSIDRRMLDILNKIQEDYEHIVHFIQIESATNFLRKLWMEWEKGKTEKRKRLLVDAEFIKSMYKTYEVLDSKHTFKLLKWTGKIVDPIYGYIDFKKVLKEVFKGKDNEKQVDNKLKKIASLIDCGAFQRLRHIKQLSTGYLINPGGTHSRFSHSIGVAYLFLKVMAYLRDDIVNIENYIDDGIIATLFHDIGHGPFSHASEMFWLRVGRKRLNKKATHETYTREYIQNGFLDLSDALDGVSFNKENVLGILGLKKPKDRNVMILSKILSNQGFDVDRLDFLLRDLYHTGKFEIDENLANLTDRIEFVNNIIKNLKVNKKRNDIYFLESGKKFLQRFIKLYVEMYDKVYYRDINRCAQSMLSKALYWAYEIGEIEIHDIPTFTDDELFVTLENSADNRVRDLIRSIKYRFLFVPTHHFLINNVHLIKEIQEKGLEEIEKELCQYAGVTERNVEDMLLIDFLPPKKIDDNMYVENTKFIFDDKNFKDTYFRLKQWQGYVFVSPQMLGKRKKLRKIKQYLQEKGISLFKTGV